MAILPECAELDAYRLENDWTFEQLASAMKLTRLGPRGGTCFIPMRTLHYLLKQMPPNAAPRERTLYKMREFLKTTRGRRRFGSRVPA